MNSLRGKTLISLGLGLAAAALAWAYLQAQESQLLRRGKMTEVIAANGYLPAYTRLQARHLLRRQVPAEYVAKGTVLDPSEIIGELSLVPFNSGEPLSYNKLAKNGESLANAVPEGRRAFSIPVDKVRGINGLLRPGDLVDVLYLNPGDKAGNGARASTLLQAVQVLAAGSLYGDQADKSETEGTLTLALSPEEAQITLLALSHGTLHLSLRSGQDSRIVSLDPAGGIELSSAYRRQAKAAPGPNPSNDDFVIKRR